MTASSIIRLTAEGIGARFDRRVVLKTVMLTAAQRFLTGCSADAGSNETPVRPEDFGGQPVPGFDNAVALRRAFDAAAQSARDVRLGSGVYEVASAALLRQGALHRPSNVALIGESRSATTVRVSGNSVINSLFEAHGSSNVLTAGMRLEGNGVKDDTAPYAGGLMSAILAADARNDMTGIRFRQCDIAGFGSAAWLNVQNLSSRHSISDVETSGCNWSSVPDSAPRAAEITVPGHFIYLFGAAGPIRGVKIDDAVMQARHIKGGVAIIGEVSDAMIAIGRLLEPGSTLYSLGDPDGPGAYGILLYQKPGRVPQRISIRVGELVDARSVGIYSAGARDVTVDIGRASGQRDTRDQTLPKGILVVLGGTQVTARIASVTDSNRVVMMSLDGGQNLGTLAGDVKFRIVLPDVVSRRGARDVSIDAGVSPWTGGVTVVGRRTGPAAVGVDLRASPTAGLQDIDLSGFRNEGASVPVVLPAQRRGISRRLLLD